MNLTEPSAVFLETGAPCVFTKADGSLSSALITCLLEDAKSERETGETSRETHEWELTCPTASVSIYGEGDQVATDAGDFEILDRIVSDRTITIFLLTPIF